MDIYIFVAIMYNRVVYFCLPVTVLFGLVKNAAKNLSESYHHNSDPETN